MKALTELYCLKVGTPLYNAVHNNIEAQQQLRDALLAVSEKKSPILAIKLPKHQYDAIFEQAKKYHVQDEKFQAIVTALSNCIAPSSYPLCVEATQLDAYIEAIQEYDGEMATHLSYYFYEASGMDNPICTCNGKEYNAKDYEEYYQFYRELND